MMDELPATTPAVDPAQDFEANRRKVAMALSMQRKQQRPGMGQLGYDLLAAWNMMRKAPQQPTGLLAPPHGPQTPPPMTSYPIEDMGGG